MISPSQVIVEALIKKKRPGKTAPGQIFLPPSFYKISQGFIYVKRNVYI